ncbi:hypothetical protein VHEMI08481 [[Torrubiella] hemipterigena]|uniref:Uncharacterized protein n=1 Tax=[Torrubiella] hemipterigena TaxID=1531966 RepID=A0A0A1TNJ7_9HYPO|nr:hypothetical protein VHEMI08481 [[Torrubiella] hemipterigena]
MLPPSTLSSSSRILALQKQWEEYRRRSDSGSHDVVDDESLADDEYENSESRDIEADFPHPQTQKIKAKEVRYRRRTFDTDDQGHRLAPIATTETPLGLQSRDESANIDMLATNKQTLELPIMNLGTSENPVIIDAPSEIDDKSQSSDAGTDDREEAIISRRQGKRRLRRYTERNTALKFASSSDDEIPAIKTTSRTETQTWEIAPGRVVNPTNSENLAFSSAFLSGHTSVSIAPDVAFNLLTLHPMRLHRFEIELRMLRSCSIAEGRVQVQILDYKFSLGTGGVFVIRPGYSCCVENAEGSDAVLHCTTVHNYELIPSPSGKVTTSANDHLH